MSRPLLVLEDTSVASRRPLFRVLGVTWAATRFAWIGPLFWCALGTATALARPENGSVWTILGTGIGYGLMLCAANLLHSLGHVLAGRVAGAPMATVLLTSTRDVTIYVDPGASAPPGRRLVRTLGGPFANLLAGGLALVLAAHAGFSSWLGTFGLFNAGIGLWTLMPVPTLDGWTVWRPLWASRRSDTP